VLQRVLQISGKDPNFASQVISIKQEEHKKLNNYNAMGQRGLSTAFTRSFLSSPSGNGSLVTVQEISGGLLKRGLVDVVMDTQGTSQEIFTVSYVHKSIRSIIFFLLGLWFLSLSVVQYNFR
jgi:microsomal triglyceride transfer protein large subunit